MARARVRTGKYIGSRVNELCRLARETAVSCRATGRRLVAVGKSAAYLVEAVNLYDNILNDDAKAMHVSFPFSGKLFDKEKDISGVITHDRLFTPSTTMTGRNQAILRIERRRAGLGPGDIVRLYEEEGVTTQFCDVAASGGGIASLVHDLICEASDSADVTLLPRLLKSIGILAFDIDGSPFDGDSSVSVGLGHGPFKAMVFPTLGHASVPVDFRQHVMGPYLASDNNPRLVPPRDYCAPDDVIILSFETPFEAQRILDNVRQQFEHEKRMRDRAAMSQAQLSVQTLFPVAADEVVEESAPTLPRHRLPSWARRALGLDKR